MTGPVRIAVLLTCFNRRARSLAALAALHRQAGRGMAFDLDIYLVDDGSTDGTGPAVRAAFPQVTVLEGTDALYWNGGMRLAFDQAMRAGFDAVLWLNDDTDLDDDAISRLLSTQAALRRAGQACTAIMGATRDPVTGACTYGGFVTKSGLLFGLQPVGPWPDHPRQVATTAGNCVLLSSEAVARVGNLEPRFLHAWGDVDYGLRLRRAGGSAWLAPGTLASCATNPEAQAWQDDPSLGFRERWSRLNSFRGLYPPDWLLFMRRHGGPLWPLAWARPYAKAALRHLQFRLGLQRGASPHSRS
jgi:GT2 family glycosyltransferase